MTEHTEAANGTTMQAVLAGLISALVGFTSSFAVVITGLAAVGATPAQAASGLAILCLTMGLGCIVFSLRWRMPVTIAWSTPGAALLATTVAPQGGFAAAVGAFVIVGVLLALTGLIGPLAYAVRLIPLPIANAMLAGILLPLCARPFLDLVESPAAIAPVIVAWLVLTRFAPRWAVVGALVTALVVMSVDGAFTEVAPADLVPTFSLVGPAFDWSTAVSIALPLYVVTMTSQNIPGIAVLSSFGYHPPIRPVMLYTGAATAAGASLGGHAINLAAISAALAAGPQAHPDKNRRWVAGVACGALYMLFGPLSAAVGAVSAAAPTGLLAAIAGLALIATFASSTAAAMNDPDHREGAVITFLVAASGVSLAGIGAAFWGLLIGLIVDLVLTRRTTR